ncbi:hypothetical protein BDW22DRAFT_969094 [Trametopsis cervina]|nr:hypothetical protein BDW22DRAFT_969094 [Trametopsis cervina]
MKYTRRPTMSRKRSSPSFRKHFCCLCITLILTQHLSSMPSCFALPVGPARCLSCVSGSTPWLTQHRGLKTHVLNPT